MIGAERERERVARRHGQWDPRLTGNVVTNHHCAREVPSGYVLVGVAAATHVRRVMEPLLIGPFLRSLGGDALPDTWSRAPDNKSLDSVW